MRERPAHRCPTHFLPAISIVMAVLVVLAFVPPVAQAKAARTGAVPRSSRSAGAVQAVAPGDATVWYLAEGYTGGEFDTWVLVQNPGTNGAKVTLDFQLPPGASAPPYQFDLPAGTRRSIHLDELSGLAATDVSTKVSATEPVVAERAMYFNYNGKVGGHDSIGVKYPAANWYLAEGYTGGDFDTYVLVQNPGTALTTVTLDFQLPPGTSAPSYQFELPGRTRRTIHLDELPGLGATDVSTKVSSPIPVVAERAVYFNYYGRDGGSDSVGVENPATAWYLAEGFTGGTFDTWVLVQNPGNEDAHVKLDFQLPPGASAPPYEFDLPARTRKSIRIDDLPGLAATDVSTHVSANRPVVSERAMYFDYYGKNDGHDSAGVTTPDCDWYLAEGYTAGDFDTYVLVQNPGKKDKKVTFHFQLPPGSSAQPYTFNLPAGTRRTVHLDDLPGLKATDVSTWVDASGPVVAERAMYFNYNGKSGGSCSTGAVYKPVIIPASTNVLNDSDMKHLVGVHDSSNRRTFTFDSSTANLRKVGVGDVIVSESRYYPMPPFKVTAISHEDGDLVLTARGAAIEETIWRGRMSLASATPKGAGAGQQNGSALVHLQKTFNVNQRVGTSSNYVDLDGSATVAFDLDFSIDIDFTAPSVDYTWKSKWGVKYLVVDVSPPSVSLNSMSFGASFTEQIAIDASVHGDFDINDWAKSVPGTKVDLPEIRFAIGPVPVWLDPYIQLAVGVDGSVHTQINAGVTQSATVSAGCAYNNSSGWSTNKSNSFSYSLRPPSASGSYTQFDCKFSLGPQVGILLYSTAGPYVNVLPGFRMTGDSNNAHPGNPLWAMYVDLDIFVGVKVQIEVGVYTWSWTVTIVDKYWHVLNWELLLANSVRVYRLSPTSGGVGSDVGVYGAGFGASRENDSYVSFGSTRAGEYPSWADDAIVCKVPPGPTGDVDVTVTRIFHDWVVGPVHVTIERTSNSKPFKVTTPGGGELLTNGDFSNSLSGWSVIDQGGSHVHGTNSLTVKTESGRKVIFMYRRCPENDGGSSGVAQALNAPTAGAGGLYLSARVKASYQRGGAIAGSDPRWYPEGPVQFRIKYRRPDGSSGEWYHGFYYGNVSGADTAHFTKVGQNSWTDYSSGDILPEIGAGSTITEFRAYGFGWDFDGYASNLSLQKI